MADDDLRKSAWFNVPETSCPDGGAAIFGIAAIIALAIALILQLAAVSKGSFLTVETFTLIGFLCLAIHLVTGWLPWRRGA